MNMRFSEEEIIDLIKAWVAISLATALTFSRGSLGVNALSAFLFAGLTVGVSFLIHELAHKFLAQHYGCWAEFRSFDAGLVLAVVMAAVGGFLFAAPGAVMIAGRTTPEEGGRIAAAGPIINLLLTLLFAAFGYLFGPSLFFTYGMALNSRLALFNLLPVGVMDGLKIMNWNPKVWAVLIAAAALLSLT